MYSLPEFSKTSARTNFHPKDTREGGKVSLLTLYTSTSVDTFSILFSINFIGRWKGQFFNNLELLSLVVISFFLVTFICDFGGDI